jgi:antitoxin component HigA of HigAB toxin-antitoxin module
MYNLKTDAQLAHVLGISTPILSRVRNRVMLITTKMILAVHKQTKMPVEKIEEMAR